MFRDRQEAGQKLAEKLAYLKGEDIIVLAIPRGGVVVGKEIASSLNCSLDIVVTKKIGAPGNPELAIGAVGPEGVRIIDEGLAVRTGAESEYIEAETENLKNKIKDKEDRLRQGKKPLSIEGKTIILTDDGIATGATIEAAIEYLKLKNPKKIIVAIPVAPPEAVKRLKPKVDEFICLKTPSMFWAVGQFYQEFPQVEDSQVIEILNTPGVC